MEDIVFTPRSVSWVQLVADQAGGFKEIEVYYDLCMKGKQFLLSLPRESHGGLMVSVLDSGSSGPGSRPIQYFQ